MFRPNPHFLLRPCIFVGAALLVCAATSPARANETASTPAAIEAPIPAPGADLTAQQWIALARRVHGGFGSYLVVGIRIGQDATQRLNAGPRDLSVLYYDGPQTPCPCVADGLMLATGASPGQGSLRIAPTKTGRDAFGVAVISNKKTGETLRYTVPQELASTLNQWNKEKDEAGRFDAVMSAPQSQIFSFYQVETS